MVTEASDGTDLQNVQLSVGANYGVVDVNSENAADHDVDCSHGAISRQVDCLMIGAFKMHGGLSDAERLYVVRWNFRDARQVEFVYFRRDFLGGLVHRLTQFVRSHIPHEFPGLFGVYDRVLTPTLRGLV